MHGKELWFTQRTLDNTIEEVKCAPSNGTKYVGAYIILHNICILHIDIFYEVWLVET